MSPKISSNGKVLSIATEFTTIDLVQRVAKSPDTADEQKPALPQQNPSTSTHQKCVPSVSKNPDLDQVVAAWDDLPDLIKAQILELVKTST